MAHILGLCPSLSLGAKGACKMDDMTWASSIRWEPPTPSALRHTGEVNQAFRRGVSSEWGAAFLLQTGGC